MNKTLSQIGNILGIIFLGIIAFMFSGFGLAGLSMMDTANKIGTIVIIIIMWTGIAYLIYNIFIKKNN